MNEKGVAIIGCGLIGQRRARTAADHPDTNVRVVVDTSTERMTAVATEFNARTAATWQDAIEHDDVAAVVVSTPNAFLVPIATAALKQGKHVLIEKPMGRNSAEAAALAEAAAASAGVLKIGFNHRYHPAIALAHERLVRGDIGRLTQLRARYGHGSRPGCENEWRANPELSGGGELLDQGVHIVDLFQWMAGPPVLVKAEIQTAVWPLQPLEDNAFGLMRFPNNVVGQFHVSMTQWKNLFSLEIHGDRGALVVEGLGGSYGVETLTHVQRAMQGGAPEVDVVRFDRPDLSWAAEWDDFTGAMHGKPLRNGSAAEGLAVMRTIDAVYGAARDSFFT